MWLDFSSFYLGPCVTKKDFLLATHLFKNIFVCLCDKFL